MTPLVVTEGRRVPALGEQDHAYPLVPGQRLEGIERRGIVWHARRLSTSMGRRGRWGEPLEPVLVVPRAFVREEGTAVAPNGEWWEIGKERCPQCGQPTERRLCKRLEEGREDTTYVIGERCRPCGWEIDLSKD